MSNEDFKPVRINWDKYPPAKKDRCTLCQGAIVDGLENVICVKKKPENILDWEGNILDTLPEKTQAYLHARCWQDFTKNPVQCRYCGSFCHAQWVPQDKDTEEIDPNTGKAVWKRKLIPIQKICNCGCHKGVAVCTMLATPSELQGTLDKLERKQQNEPR